MIGNSEKILNSNINTSDILKDALVPSNKSPHGLWSFLIESTMLSLQIETDWNGSIVIKTELSEVQSSDVDIGLTTFDRNFEINFFCRQQ